MRLDIAGSDEDSLPPANLGGIGKRAAVVLRKPDPFSALNALLDRCILLGFSSIGRTLRVPLQGLV